MAEATEGTEGEGEYEDNTEVPLATEAMGEGEEEDAEDLFSRLGESSDDPEQQRKYREYLALIKEIDCQNKLIDGIKVEVMELCKRQCKTRNEMREIKRLRICMEQENIKLHTMMNKAIQLQNYGSPRHYKDLALSTTIDEDAVPPYNFFSSAAAGGEKSDSCPDPCEQPCPPPCPPPCPSPCPPPCPPPCPGSSDNDRMKQTLCKLMAKMKVCCPEDKKLIQEIVCALQGSQKKKVSMPCGNDDGHKKSHRKHHQAAESNSLETLKQRIVCMQSSVKKLLNEVVKRESSPVAKGGGSSCMSDESSFTKLLSACAPPCPSPCGETGGGGGGGGQKQPVCEEDPDPLVICGGKRSKSDKYEKLKENYTRLLTEFQRKDCQMKELEKRMKGLCGSCGGGAGGKGGDADAAELNLLRARVNEMKEEQAEFKCIMKEQSQQLEDYRNKYLLAQQKVEEQCVALEKLNMNNKRIEQQINSEVKEIRQKFQEKLSELLHFPKLLENEQLKLAQVCKEKDDLQAKLVVVCKELKQLKSQSTSTEAVDCRPQLAQCQLELSQAKAELEELLRQRDLFCEQLKATQDDLDTLRTESAKIIAGTKERAELIKQQQQEQINRLERELAQCRATASLSVNDREAVIREMQGQLNTLSYSFDAAQKQIKTLRNHIAYVSNENCFPVKC